MTAGPIAESVGKAFLRVPLARMKVLRELSPLEEVIEALQKADTATVLIVKADGELAGAITFGDLLKYSVVNGSLPKTAREAMNANPLSRSTEAKLRDYEIPPSIRLVPIVKGSSKLCGAWVRRKSTPDPQSTAVLLVAGGKGMRLRPATKTVPKPLLEVGGIPILQRLVENLVASGFHRLYISVSYLAEKIVSYFGDGSEFDCSITYIHEDRPLGTAGCLARLPAEETTILLANADLLTDIDFSRVLEAHYHAGSVITMVTREVVIRSEYGIVETDSAGLVTKLQEKPAFTQTINGGIYAIEMEATRNLFPDGSFSATDLINLALESELTVKTWLSHDLWLDLGRPEDLTRANQAYKLTQNLPHG